MKEIKFKQTGKNAFEIRYEANLSLFQFRIKESIGMPYAFLEVRCRVHNDTLYYNVYQKSCKTLDGAIKEANDFVKGHLQEMGVKDNE